MKVLLGCTNSHLANYDPKCKLIYFNKCIAHCLHKVYIISCPKSPNNLSLRELNAYVMIKALTF